MLRGMIKNFKTWTVRVYSMGRINQFLLALAIRAATCMYAQMSDTCCDWNNIWLDAWQ